MLNKSANISYCKEIACLSKAKVWRRPTFFERYLSNWSFHHELWLCPEFYALDYVQLDIGRAQNTQATTTSIANFRTLNYDYSDLVAVLYLPLCQCTFVYNTIWDSLLQRVWRRNSWRCQLSTFSKLSCKCSSVINIFGGRMIFFRLVSMFCDKIMQIRC